MSGTIRGIYNNGQVILEETPEINGPAEVWVTFTGDVVLHNKKPALCINSRLAELALLQDGWLNGEGLTPIKEDLDLFAVMFEINFDKTLPPPYLYPTINGGLQSEWIGNNYDISLMLILQAKKHFANTWMRLTTPLMKFPLT